MAIVSVTWSSTDNGSAITSVDHGSASTGSNTSEVTIYLRHDGANEITNAQMYFSQKSGAYTGDYTAAGDMTTLLGWGDTGITNDWGGIQINMDKVGGYSGGSTWGMDTTNKTSVDNLKYTVRTGVGDSSVNGILLRTTMSTSMITNGTIPASITDVAFKMRIKIPTSETNGGTRQFDQNLIFTYTT